MNASRVKFFSVAKPTIVATSTGKPEFSVVTHCVLQRDKLCRVPSVYWISFSKKGICYTEVIWLTSGLVCIQPFHSFPAFMAEGKKSIFGWITHIKRALSQLFCLVIFGHWCQGWSMLCTAMSNPRSITFYVTLKPPPRCLFFLSQKWSRDSRAPFRTQLVLQGQ